ncbi:hypothetical protein H5410_056402 [Solanum commersonii]|uniref:Uncharacterized protein n=1 Tax=Solanum commersonii TaxID=4109 RepID=A0A9J5WM58_SOLCO|nr:hypothetical protein H5410_056402 [Solanum commersonii]
MSEMGIYPHPQFLGAKQGGLGDNLARDFPQILRQIRELQMDFIFAELEECNLHMVRVFYANWAPEARSHFVTVRGFNVPITPSSINDILDITRGRVCLVYALMTGTELNILAVLNFAMRKVRVHNGHMYAFGGLITRICSVAGVLEENADYMAPLFPATVDITRTKGPDTELGSTITTAECHRRDELIMTRMYGLEMLRHHNGCLASTDMQLGDVERCCPLNDHAKALLGIGPAFREPIDNVILTDEERLQTSSNVESDSDEEVDPA